MNWFPRWITLDLSSLRFFANLSKEGEAREFLFQARPSNGEFLIPSRFNYSGGAPWPLHDYGLKYIEDGTAHISEGPSKNGYLGVLSYVPPFEHRPDGCFELKAWVSRETFQFLLNSYRHSMDYRLTFTFAPKDEDVVKTYYDEFTKKRLVAWDTEAEMDILAGAITIEVLADRMIVEGAKKVSVSHEDNVVKEHIGHEGTERLLPSHAELIAKVAEIKRIGYWLVALLCTILAVLLLS